MKSWSTFKASPFRNYYLCKDSTVTSFTASDVDNRINQLDSEVKAMKETFDITLADKQNMEAAISSEKRKGEG